MKELGITKGEWKVDDDVFSINCPNEVKIDVMGRLEIYREKDMICEIIVDAGNTAQKCGLLPSELLQQRDELKEALINVMVVVRDCYPLLFDNEKPAVKQAEAAIKNTETK